MKIELTNCGMIFNKFSHTKFSDVDTRSGWYTNSSIWAKRPDNVLLYTYKILDISDIRGTITIKSNSAQTAQIYFFGEPLTEEDGAVDNVLTTRSQGYLDVNTEKTVAIPDEAKYLYLQLTKGTGTSVMPDKLVYVEKNYSLL